MPTVLKNLLRRTYTAESIGAPPLQVDLARRGEPGDSTGPLNDSQITGAALLPGYGFEVALVQVADLPVAESPVAKAKAKPAPLTPPSDSPLTPSKEA